MLKGIRQFFDSHIQSTNAGASRNSSERGLQLATASLLIEVSRADFSISAEERRAINQSIKEIFSLSDDEGETLVLLAESEINNSTCLYEFTRLVNDNYDYQQKLKIVEKMWQVAFADLHKDKYEEHLIRRVCDLLYISHQDFVRLREARKDA